MELIKLKTTVFLIVFLFTCLIGKTQAPIVGNNTGAGNCLGFAGNQYVDCGNPASLQITSDMTISAWIFPTNLSTGGGAVVTKRPSNIEQTMSYEFDVIGGNVRLGLGNGLCVSCSNFAVGGTVALNVWQYITGVISGNNISVYLNGVLVGSGTFSGTRQNGGDMHIARLGTGSSYDFIGEMDEVRIWNRALTQNEIRDSMCKKLKGTETGLAGCWRMDEGSGTTTADVTANGNTGTLH